MPTENGKEESELTKEEKAFLMRALWKAFQAPAWTKDELIELGKAIFAKETLKSMTDKRFEIIYPRLVSIVESLGAQLAEQSAAMLRKEEEAKKGDGDGDSGDGEGEGEGESGKKDEKKEDKK